MISISTRVNVYIHIGLPVVNIFSHYQFQVRRRDAMLRTISMIMISIYQIKWLIYINCISSGISDAGLCVSSNTLLANRLAVHDLTNTINCCSYFRTGDSDADHSCLFISFDIWFGHGFVCVRAEVESISFRNSFLWLNCNI